MPPFLGAMFGPPGTTAETFRPTADAILAQMTAADPAGRRKQTAEGGPLTDAQMDGHYKAACTPLKGVVLKRIPASAHFIMWDQPQRFQGEVKAFLR